MIGQNVSHCVGCEGENMGCFRKAVGKGSHYSLGCSLELFVVDLLKEAVKEGVTQLGTLYHMT